MCSNRILIERLVVSRLDQNFDCIRSHWRHRATRFTTTSGITPTAGRSITETISTEGAPAEATLIAVAAHAQVTSVAVGENAEANRIGVAPNAAPKRTEAETLVKAT